MDCRPIHVDIQFELLWGRAYSAGCLAFFCVWHTIVPAVYVSHVRLRRHFLCFVAYDGAASHSRELPFQRSRAPIPVIDSAPNAQSAHLPRMIEVYQAICPLPARALRNSIHTGGRSSDTIETHDSGSSESKTKLGRKSTAACAIIGRSNKCPRQKPQLEISGYASRRNTTLGAPGHIRACGFFSTPSASRMKVVTRYSSSLDIG